MVEIQKSGRAARVEVNRWRPRCYVCECFVAMEAHDVFYDYYSGCWEEGYTACPKHGGPSSERIAEIRAERLASTTQPEVAPKSSPLPVSASSVEARRPENQGAGDGHSPSSGGGSA